MLEVLRGLLLGQRQHVVRHVHAPRRAPDAAAHAEPVARAQLVADRAQTVVPRMPAAELDADGAGVDVQLVVNDDQVVGSDAVGVAQLLDRAARGVHVALGLGQHHVDVVVGALGRERAALGLPVPRAHFRADEVHGVEPGVMPGVRVFLARVPQADDQIHERSSIIERHSSRKVESRFGLSRLPPRTISARSPLRARDPGDPARAAYFGYASPRDRARGGFSASMRFALGRTAETPTRTGSPPSRCCRRSGWSGRTAGPAT